MRFEEARVIFDHGHARLSPALVKTAGQDQARLEADYALEDETLDLTISDSILQRADEVIE